tara:strand:- start:2326 stop:3564 length:1239 start_codon:yes stop_codon:yes gene_type:complete
MIHHSRKVTFEGAQGDALDARLELPPFGPVRAYAVFAHCFTCNKDIFATSRIARALARRGIAVLRFDFTGLGQSEGDFANSNFTSNIGDLMAACAFLAQQYVAPELLIGHSLGGAAVLAAAQDLPDVKAVATIGAPSDPGHINHMFEEKMDEITRHGEAVVDLSGRPFTITRQFIEDVQNHRIVDRLKDLGKALLVMHSPTDQVVSVDHARILYEHARHPKSFISLDGADHLLRGKRDAEFAAEMLSAWCGRYISPLEKRDAPDGDKVLVEETGLGNFLQEVIYGDHAFLVDEPQRVGGDNEGPTPYAYLLAALGACTSMTLRMYARHKNLPLEHVRVTLEHDRLHARDCADCSEQEDPDAKIEVMRRRVVVRGDLTQEQLDGLLRIADKCPVHRTLESRPEVITKIEKEGE